MSVREDFRKGLPTTIAILGDSTTSGYGANGAANWTAGDPLEVVMDAIGTTSQATQDNLNIPSACRLLATYAKQLNPANVVYNYSGSGWRAAEHVSKNTVARLAARTPKPKICFINSGINSAKLGQTQGASYQTLINQLIANSIEPVVTIGHNIGTYPSNFTPMPFWQTLRTEMKSFAASNNLPLLDMGSDDGVLGGLYDPFHPNAAGYKAIFNFYMKYLRISNYSISGLIGAPLRVSGYQLKEECFQ